jgi:hypothetical protein
MKRIAGALAVLWLTGCGSGVPEAPKPSKLVEVSGKVTMAGEPLDGSVVIFTPASAGGFIGHGFTDSTGKYVAETRSGDSIEPGLAPGSYKVLVSRFLKPDGTVPADPTEPPAMSGARESLPMEYSSPTGSRLRAVVGQSGGVFDYEIKKK